MGARKQLGIFDLTMIVVSFVIGMGIFRAPVNVASAVPNVTTYFLCWLAGGVVALCGALTYAEIGSRLPVTGGYYKVFAYAYHPSVAFAINCIILVSNTASMAAVALVGAEYVVGIFWPHGAGAISVKTLEIALAIISIIIFYGVNVFGLRTSASVQNVLMVIKIGLVLLLILPVFLEHQTVVHHITNTDEIPFSGYLKAFGIGLIAVSFTYGGYQQTINFGEEIKQPLRNIPRGIFFAISIIIILYLLVNYAYINVIGFEQLKESKNIAAIMAAKVLGKDAGIVLSVLLFLGVLGYINGTLLSSPRVMYAMSVDKVFPGLFARTNARGALTFSLTIFSLISALIVFWAEAFDKILGFTIFLECFGMVFSAGSIFIIRKRTVHLNGSGIFSMKLYPLLPVIFITAYVFIAISIALDYKKNGYAALTGVAVLSAFMLIYFILLHKKKNKEAA